MTINAESRSTLNSDRQRRRKYYRVFLNGRDVSLQCHYADARRGVVRLFVKDPNGKWRINETRDGVVREERRGRVRIMRTSGPIGWT